MLSKGGLEQDASELKGQKYEAEQIERGQPFASIGLEGPEWFGFHNFVSIALFS